MDRALILVLIAAVQRERMRVEILRLRQQREHPMAGEIRDALARFKTAHARMTANIVAEMDKATATTALVEKEGMAAVQMPAAMLAAARAEIRDITSEFSTKTNGAPDDPLLGAEQALPQGSANSAIQQSAGGSIAAEASSQGTVIMPPWKPMDEAPRVDAANKPVPIKLFLPAAKFQTDAQGKPFDVSDVETVGVFDPSLQHWVDQKTGAKVYPSQWQPL